MLTAEQISFLEKMDHCFDQAVFDESSGLCPEQLRAKIREVYENGGKNGVPFPVTRARMVAAFLQDVRIAVNDFDPFACIIERRNMTNGPANEILKIQQERKDASEKALSALYKEDFFTSETGISRVRLDLSHTVPDWDNILTLGVPGLLARAEEAHRKNPCPFTESVVIVYTAFRDFLERYARIAVCKDRSDIAEMLRFLAENPPSTLKEALELSLLYRELQEIEGEWLRSMGIFDRQYLRFYEHDLAAGILTQESASELLLFYFARFHIQSRSRDMGTPFAFGGLLPDGTDGCNALTLLAFKAFRDLGKVDPKFSLRVNSQTPDEVLLFAAECLKEGKTAVVFANEDIARQSFLRQGKTPEELCNFVPVGCYEPAIMGKELTCTMSVLFNLAGLFDELFSDASFNPQDFEDVLNKYMELSEERLRRCMHVSGLLEKDWYQVNPSPLLSGTMDECMMQALDVSQYGTKYAQSGIMCAGIGTAADALAAIEHLVFEKKKVTFRQLGQILAADWQGEEQLRLYALRRTPKWGRGEEKADRIACAVTQRISTLIRNTPNVKGGDFLMGLWSIDWAYAMGSELGATADGRKAGAPLSKNTGSTTGCDTEGVAGLMESVCKLDHSLFSDGAVLDVILSHGMTEGENGSLLIVDLIRTFFERGGFFIHFNILSSAMLREAQKNPDQYSTLQIRLCGWNVRFIDLRKTIQDDLISQTETGENL